jgi:hypothetical protein
MVDTTGEVFIWLLCVVVASLLPAIHDGRLPTVDIYRDKKKKRGTKPFLV